MDSSRERRRGALVVLSTGMFLLALLVGGASAALGQAGYTGVPTSPPPGDVYVEPVSLDPYTSLGPPVPARSPAVAPLGGPGGPVSVASRRLDDLGPTTEQPDGRLVTGWDLVTLAGLGLTAVVAFAMSAGRFRAH